MLFRSATLTALGMLFLAGVLFVVSRGCAKHRNYTVEQAAEHIGLTLVYDRQEMLYVQVWMRDPSQWTGSPPATQAKVPPGMLVMVKDNRGGATIGVTKGAKIDDTEVWGDEEELTRLLEALDLN